MKRLLVCALLLVVALPLFAERILLPVWTPPVHGAFGSEFRTDLRIYNDGSKAVDIQGLAAYCAVCLAPPLLYHLAPGEELEPGEVQPTGTPGRFLRIADEDVDALSMNLRAYDVSRNATNFGTEIPIVRERDFRINRIVLVGVPTDARFRNTLRIYTAFPIPVSVQVGNAPPVKLQLTSDEPLFNPAYAIFTGFPTGTAPVRVTIEVEPDFVSLLPIEVPVWAFITVTNNDTQTITTITPQR